MAREAELVGEFREIVDWVIQKQAEDYQKGKVFGLHRATNHPHIVTAAGLIFTSQLGPDGKATKYPFCARDERMWNVESQDPGQVGRYSGQLAVASFASRPDQLIRTWTVDSRISMFTPKAQRLLTAVEDLEAALAWIKSPHLAADSYDRISAVSPEELGVIENRLAEDELTVGSYVPPRRHIPGPAWQQPIA